MKPRIVGLETEFGFVLRGEKGIQRYHKLVWVLPKQFLENGGLVYVNAKGGGHARDAEDVTHPEYATPEILVPDYLEDVVAYDKAGELILTRNLPMFQLFKHNCDFYGHHFGCHENYSFVLLKPNIESLLAPFFLAR